MKYFLLLSLLTLPAAAFAADQAFVPLTSIPGLTDAGASLNLPIFLNNFYKICIGLASILAVLQLIRAGLMYMMGDSITEKKEARNLIGLSVLGLILVLSPVIVFGLINKDILELNLDVKVLTPKRTFLDSASVVVPYVSDKDCEDKGGTVAGVAPNKTCTVPAKSAAGGAAAACSNFTNPTPLAEAGSCSAEVGESFSRVEQTCCAGIQAGYQCCAKRAAEDYSSILPAPITYSIYVYAAVQKNTYEDPVAADLSRVNEFSQLCVAAKGEVLTSYTSAKVRDCSTEELAGYSKGSTTYIRCIDAVKSSCRLKY